MPSPSPQVSSSSNRMPEFQTDSNDNANPRFRHRQRGGGFANHQNRGARNFNNNNNQRNSHQASSSSAAEKNVPPASAFMGRSLLGRQSAEEHLKQMTPEVRKWVAELAPVLEMYDYDARDIADLVKQCQFDPVKIQNAVDAVFEEKRGHELGEWQVSRGKRRHSGPRKDDVPTPQQQTPDHNYRQPQRGRNFNNSGPNNNNNNKSQFNNNDTQTNNNNRTSPVPNGNGSAPTTTTVPNGSPPAQEAVGGHESSLGEDWTDNDRQKGRRQFGGNDTQRQQQPYHQQQQQRRRSMNSVSRGGGRPRGSRLRGDSRDNSNHRKEDRKEETQTSWNNSAKETTTPNVESPAVAKASPPNSWARIAAGALEKKKSPASAGTSPVQQATPVSLSETSPPAGTNTTTAETSEAAESRPVSSTEKHEAEKATATSADDSDAVEETNQASDNEEELEVEESEQATTQIGGATASPMLKQAPVPAVQLSPLQQPQQAPLAQPQPTQTTAAHRSPSVSPQPASIQDPSPSSPLPVHQPSPSIVPDSGVVVDQHTAALLAEAPTDDVVLPPPAGRDVVLPRHIAGTSSRFDNRAGFVFGSLQRGIAGYPRAVPDVRFGVPSATEDVQASSSGPPGLAESARTAPRASSKPVELTSEQQKVDAYPEDPAIVERKAPATTKPRSDYETAPAAAAAMVAPQVVPQQAVSHQEQPQPQQQHGMYDAYPLQHHGYHQQHRLQEFGGMEDQQQGPPRRHYNNSMMYHNNQTPSVQGGGQLKSQRPNNQNNRMNYGNRNNSGGLGYHHHNNNVQQSHHQNFGGAHHDDYTDRIPQHYNNQYYNQRGMSNRGYGSFRQQDYNTPIGFSNDLSGVVPDTTTTSSTSITAQQQQTAYAANTYSNYSYGSVGYGETPAHLQHDASGQASTEYQSYHQQQQRGYNQMGYRPYGQQLSGGYGNHQVDLQQQQQQQHKAPVQQQQHYGQQQQQPPAANNRFGSSTDATNGSVDSRQSQQQAQTQSQQPQQQQAQADTSSTQQSSSTTSSQTHPSSAQQSQMWRQPNPSNSSFALYDPQTRQQTNFASATGYDYDQAQQQQQPQSFDHASAGSLRYQQQQPLMQNTAAPASTHHHQMMMVDNTNTTGASGTGTHRGYGTANPSANYSHHAAAAAATHPNYLYDTTNTSTAASGGVPMDYTSTNALLQQHGVQAAHVGGFTAATSHQGQRTATALDQSYATGMYGYGGSAQPYPAQSSRHL